MLKRQQTQDIHQLHQQLSLDGVQLLQGISLAKNISITPAGALAVLRAGVFKMSAQIIVRNPSNQARFHNYILH